MAGLNKKLNPYAEELDELYDRCPKAVLAAIAVSALTCGGDWLEDAQKNVAKEWQNLHQAGIVPQKPPAKFLPNDDEPPPMGLVSE